MNTQCSTCLSEHRLDIDRMIVEGVPLRELARRFGLGRASVQRHAQHRRARALADGMTSSAVAVGTVATRVLDSRESISDRLRELATTAAKLGELAIRTHDPALLARAIRAERDVLEALDRRVPLDAAVEQAERRTLQVVAQAAVDVLGRDAAQRLADRVNANLITGTAA